MSISLLLRHLRVLGPRPIFLLALVLGVVGVPRAGASSVVPGMAGDFQVVASDFTFEDGVHLSWPAADADAVYFRL